MKQYLYGATLLGAATLGFLEVGSAQAPMAGPAPVAVAAATTPFTAAQIIAQAQETSEAQLQALTPRRRDSLDWISGAMWAGIAEFAKISKRPLESDAVRQLGEKAKWTPGNATKKPFHADDDTIGQAFLADYALSHNPAALAPTRADMDALVEHLNAPVDHPRPVAWWWCDALFMAPPVLSHLSQLTGDRKYLDAMDKEWWKTSTRLYDTEEHLFFRDPGYLNRRSANGQKVFWSRGNGWVLAGLARVLTWMPSDYPTRPKYEQQFREMSAKLLTLQGSDGMWRSSLLDTAAFPEPESSGTSFFCYGFAWGINNGLLPRQTYQVAANRAWNALVAHRRADKLPGFVQPVGAEPKSPTPQGTQLYATGGFLLAATELSKLPTLTQAEFAPQGGPTSPTPEAHAVATVPAKRTPITGRAYVRHVPERLDDIAWENNRIAFRTYGPELEKHEKTGSGIDVWVKSTRRMVLGVGDWYAGDYHKDHGEGLDYYHVGQTRGCGGLGVWSGGQLHVSRTWSRYNILRAGPDSAQFQLFYEPWDAGGRKIWETRVITLDADSNLNRMESTLYSDKPGEIIVGIGIAKTVGDKPTQDAARGLLASWAAPTPDGIIGCGVLVDPKTLSGFTEDALNRLVLVRAMPGKPFVYHAGGAWNKSGDFKTEADWLNYLQAFRR